MKIWFIIFFISLITLYLKNNHVLKYLLLDILNLIFSFHKFLLFLYNYLYKYFPAWVEDKLDFYIHGTKTHGLSDCYEYFIEKKYKLVIAPDSSSNDYEQCLMLNKGGAKVVILDHHEVDNLKVAP